MRHDFVGRSLSNYTSLYFFVWQSFFVFCCSTSNREIYHCRIGTPLQSSSKTCTVPLQKHHGKILPTARSIKLFFYAQNHNLKSTSRKSPAQLFFVRVRGESTTSTAWFPQQFVGTRLQCCGGWPEAVSLKSSLCRQRVPFQPVPNRESEKNQLFNGQRVKCKGINTTDAGQNDFGCTKLKQKSQCQRLACLRYIAVTLEMRHSKRTSGNKRLQLTIRFVLVKFNITRSLTLKSTRLRLYCHLTFPLLTQWALPALRLASDAERR